MFCLMFRNVRDEPNAEVLIPIVAALNASDFLFAGAPLHPELFDKRVRPNVTTLPSQKLGPSRTGPKLSESGTWSDHSGDDAA